VVFRSYLSTSQALIKEQKESDADLIPGMILKDFALFSTKRSVYVNEAPDRLNPYLSSISKDPPKGGKPKIAFD
jgi:hypothetical protein